MDSRVEWLLGALLNGDSIENFEPRSRLESYLKAVIEKTGVNNLEVPRSRLDALLYELADKAPNDYAKAIEEGKEAENKAFWASYTNNGASNDYSSAFRAWTNRCFKPCYNIVPTNAINMFLTTKITGDLAQIFTDCGVVLDFSNCTNLEGTFYNTDLTRIPTVDMRKAYIHNTFYYSSDLETIDKIIVNESRTFPDSNVFRCSSLKNIVVEGTIGKTIYFNYCSKLTVDSAKSIINALKNYAGTDKELTYTLKFHADVWTRLNASGVAPNGSTWEEYVATLGWNI